MSEDWKKLRETVEDMIENIEDYTHITPDRSVLLLIDKLKKEEKNNE